MNRPARNCDASLSEAARWMTSASDGGRKRNACAVAKKKPRLPVSSNAPGRSRNCSSNRMRTAMRGRADQPERFSMASLAPVSDARANAASATRATRQAFFACERIEESRATPERR
eukprot:3973788-Pyramimonas_sp.AAC.1